MQMILFLTRENSPAHLLSRRRKAVPSRTVRTVISEPTIQLFDRPAPIVPITPRHPARRSDPALVEEDPERWDGLS
ncbi:MAG: hypothetical protein KatS3mg104_0320 [Phycisphaerae bacterium]|jgi:hypothetical protein|nr:MAG: hypothetical protein KatS3mg104_0320 [Phycisphaerae bacterium]